MKESRKKFGRALRLSFQFLPIHSFLKNGAFIDFLSGVNARFSASTE